MKIYDNVSHRSIQVKPEEVNINGTRAFYRDGLAAIALHGNKVIRLDPNSGKAYRQQAIIANNYRKVWEKMFAAL